MHGAPSSSSTVVMLPGTGVWHTSHASRCRASSSASSVGVLTWIAVGGSPYTVEPVSVVMVLSSICAVSSANNALARKAPSYGLIPKHRDVHRAYQDDPAVIGSNPSGSEPFPDFAAGNAGAGRPLGNAGMPWPRGRPPQMW